MKKGFTLGQLPQVFLVILFIGIIVGASYMVLATFQNTLLTPTNVVNESINFAVNYTNYSTAHYPILSITQIANATKTIPSDKYGTNANSLGQAYQIYINTNATYVVGTYLVTYVYNGPTKGSEGVGYILDFIDNITTNLPTVGIIVFIVVLLGVLMYIRMKKTSGGA